MHIRAVQWFGVLFGLASGCSEPSVGTEGALERSEITGPPAVSIGGKDTRPGYLLERVVGMTLLTDGRIAVADGGSNELHYYSEEGVHLRTVGGEGQGPGEFLGLNGLFRGDGDTLYALAFSPGLTVFSPDGEVDREYRFSLSEIRVPCYFWSEVAVGSGPVILATHELNRGVRECPPPPEGLHRDSVLLARHSPMDGTFERVAPVPGVQRVGDDYRPYGALPINAWDWNGVVIGATDSEAVTLVDLQGTKLGEVPVPWSAREIPSSAKTEAAPELENRDGSTRIGELWNYPDAYPRLGRVVYDRSGWIWFMRYPDFENPALSTSIRYPSIGQVGVEGGSRWQVVSVDGTMASEVWFPVGFHLWEARSEYALGLHRDELDLETVQLYKRHAS